MAESPDETEDMPGNSDGYDRRLSSLERWREQIDNERGAIMGELGEIKGIMQSLGPQISNLSTRFSSVEEKLEDRPSRTEFKEAERQIDSIRAKGIRFSELEVSGPANMKFKLLGVSGVTIVLVFFLIVVIFALWFLRK